tara:strand:- start:350 stop:595 length:246 start_codon:yes stop_codon:yes gene_type:complete
MEAEKFGKFIGSIIHDPRKLYLISLVLIILFPPINRVPSTRAFFEGWNFITKLGGIYHINITYISIEFAIVTVAFLLFRKK